MARAIAAPTAPDQRSRIMLIVALLFAGVAAALIFVALQRGGETATSGPTAGVPVVVASQDVPANTTLTAAMLELRSLAEGDVLAGTYGAVDALVGQPTRFPLQAGEQVTGLKVGLGSVTDDEDLSLVLPPGKRAVAVEVSEVTGVGGLLLPRNFVDVIAVFPNAPGGATDDPAAIKSVTLLQNIEVLAVAQEAQEPVPVGSDGDAGPRGQRAGDAERQPDATSATLAVTSEEAQLLALVQETGGVIWLVLRPAGDQDLLPLGESNLLPFLPAP